MKSKRILKYSGISLGLLVLVSWIIILSGDPLAEGRTELSFHLVSEAAMALLCISGGILINKHTGRGLLLLTTGFSMMVYSSLNALGYYAELKDPAMMILMGAVCAASCLLLISSLRQCITNMNPESN